MRSRTVDGPRTTNRSTRGPARRQLSILSVLAMTLGFLVAAGATTPAQAAQASGHDVPAWSNGWSWTYATSFRYQADGTDVTINESVTYSVVGKTNFNGHDAYKLAITGDITGGSGDVAAGGFNAKLSNFDGDVTGTRYIRRSDLALLSESQHQDLTADAKVGFITQGITADVNLQLTPSPSWKTHDFPLNAGDSWQHDEDIAYTGGFSYDAGSIGGTGSSPFNGTLPFSAPAQVSSATINPGGSIGNVATDVISAQTAGGQTVDNHWWSPTHKNDARHIMVLPLDGAKLTITRNLNSANTPAPATTITATATPSLTCAGGDVTVAGKLSTGASGVVVGVRLDQSQRTPGLGVTPSTTTTTTAGGNYSATLKAPSQSDGLSKNGSRANWGVVVDGGGASNVTTVVVTPVNCSTVEYTGATSASQGTTAVVSAKLTDLTGGNVNNRQLTFSLSGGGSVNATTNAAGVATANLAVPGPVRSTNISVSYAGTSTLAAASDTSLFEVGKVATTTTVVPSESPATVDEPVTFTASVTPELAGEPGGSVQFVVDGSNFGQPVALVDGSATSSGLAFSEVGSHTVTATYVGDANFASSVSPAVAFEVRPPLLVTTTTSATTPTSSVFGQPVELSATVSETGGGATPTGTVTFSEGGTTIATAPLDGAGAASASVADLTVGSHSVVATYSGDDTYRSSAASPKNVSVAKAAVAVELVSTDTTTVSGQAVNLSVDVAAQAPGAGAPDGEVQLLVDGETVGDPVELVNGAATFPPLTSLLTGSRALAVTYAGSASYESGGDTVTQEVNQAETVTAVVATPSPSNEGQNVALTANVSAVAPGSGSPTGTLVFSADGTTLGAATLEPGADGSQATLNVADLAPGSYSILASYVGDDDYAASDSEPISQTVIAGAAIVETSTSVTSSDNPSTFGELITFTATVATDGDSAPLGAVQFSIDSVNIGGPVPVDASGVAVSPTLGSPEPGDHTVIATFVPDAGFSGSGDIITQTVEGAGVDLEVVSSGSPSAYGEGVTFTATVAAQQSGVGTPSGVVQFKIDGVPLGGAVDLEDGVATSVSIADLTPGNHEVSVLYSADTRFTSATTTLDQDVEKIATTTTLEASTTSATAGQAVELTATVAPGQGALGVPGGSVSFVDGDTTLATVPLTPGAGDNGTASVSVSDLGAGSHSIKAVYSGTASFATSQSAPVAVAVAKRATSIKADAAVVRLWPLGLPLGRLRVTLTSGQDPVVGAPIEFKVGPRSVCTTTTDANGVATCNAFSQLLGLILFNGYKAYFAGDDTHLPSDAKGVVLK